MYYILCLWLPRGEINKCSRVGYHCAGDLYYTTFCLSQHCSGAQDNSADVDAGRRLNETALMLDDLPAPTTQVRFRCAFHWPRLSAVPCSYRCAGAPDDSSEVDERNDNARERYELQPKGSGSGSNNESRQNSSSKMTTGQAATAV